MPQVARAIGTRAMGMFGPILVAPGGCDALLADVATSLCGQEKGAFMRTRGV